MDTLVLGGAITDSHVSNCIKKKPPGTAVCPPGSLSSSTVLLLDQIIQAPVKLNYAKLRESH